MQLLQSHIKLEKYQNSAFGENSTPLAFPAQQKLRCLLTTGIVLILVVFCRSRRQPYRWLFLPPLQTETGWGGGVVVGVEKRAQHRVRGCCEFSLGCKVWGKVKAVACMKTMDWEGIPYVTLESVP